MKQYQPLKPSWKSICLLALVLVIPITLILNYGSIVMNSVDTQARSQEVQTALKKINEQLSIIMNRREQKLSKIFIKSDVHNYTWEEGINLRLNEKTSQNLWISPLSNHKKIRILNILVDQRLFQSISSKIKVNIQRGLFWFNAEYNMDLQLFFWNQTLNLNQPQETTIVLNLQELRYDWIDQNIGYKLRKGEYRNQYYLQDILKQLRSTVLFSHCSYTSTACQLTTFIVMPPTNYQNSFLKVDSQVYFIENTSPKVFYHLLADFLQVYELQQLKNIGNGKKQGIVEVYKLLKVEAYLRQTKDILSYLYFTYHPLENLWTQVQRSWKESPEKLFEFFKKGKYLSPYIHNHEEDLIVQEILNNYNQFLATQRITSKLEVNPLTDVRVGRIDLFPNDFKLGVYLPLVIIFVYPLFIKLKDLLSAIFFLTKQKFQCKEAIEGQDKVHTE